MSKTKAPQYPYPPITTSSVVALCSYNSTAKLSNATWENKLSEPVVLNQGDSMFVKNVFIDTRTQPSGNIIIEEDTIIGLEFFFYYINRGGSLCPSSFQDYPAITNMKEQIRFNETNTYNVPFNSVTGPPNGNSFPMDPLQNLPGLPAFDLTQTNEQTSANLMPVTETIYYAPNVLPANPPEYAAYTAHQKRNNPVAFVMPSAVNSGDGLPYILCTTSAIESPGTPVVLPALGCFKGVPSPTFIFPALQNIPTTPPPAGSATINLQSIYWGLQNNEQTNLVSFQVSYDVGDTEYSIALLSPGDQICGDLSFIIPGTYFPTGSSPANDLAITYDFQLITTTYTYGPFGLSTNSGYNSAIYPTYPSNIFNGYASNEKFDSLYIVYNASLPLNHRYFVQGANFESAPPPTITWSMPSIYVGDSTNSFVLTLTWTEVGDDITITYNPPEGDDQFIPKAVGPLIGLTAIGTPPNPSISTPNNIMQLPDTIIPYTKSWEMTIPKGSYTPDFLAEYVTRGMSNNKIKIEREYLDQAANPAVVTMEGTFSVPTALINGQFINPDYINPVNPNESTQNVQHVEPSGGIPPIDLLEGSFTIDPPYTAAYQPSLFFSSKNPASYPNSEAVPPVQPSAGPFNGNFNSPTDNDNDDLPFLFRPNTFTSDWQIAADGASGFPAGTTPYPTAYLPEQSVRLCLNDNNMQTYNNMPAQNFFPPEAPLVDMYYRPLCSDVYSMFFKQARDGFPPIPTNIPADNDYAIRPILSTQKVQFSLANKDDEVVNTTEYGWVDISTPVVGATQMSLLWNAENSGVFSLPYLHSPILAKSDPSVTSPVESTALYVNSFAVGPQGGYKNGVVMADKQSGILLRKMYSKTISGRPVKFWESLGFDTDAITCDYDKDNPSAPFLTWKQFQKKTTGGFSGASNIYNPRLSTLSTGEICYGSYVDCSNFTGWYNQLGWWIQPAEPDYDCILFTDQTLANSAIYYAVTTTNAINARTIPLDQNDAGHYLLEITGYNSSFINDTEMREIKAIISTYYVTSNAFVTSPTPDSYQYYHLSNTPMTMSNLKIRIINPITMNEVSNLGPNNSIYLQINKIFTLREQLQAPPNP